MRKTKKPIYFTLFILIFMIISLYYLFKNDKDHNNEICETKLKTIKGVIVANGGHGAYIWTQVDNLEKSVSLNILKTQYIKGFSDDYTYQVGDSIIKKAGSKEFTIKKGENIAIHVINCDE